MVPSEAVEPAARRRLVLGTAAAVRWLVEGGLDVHGAALHLRAPELEHTHLEDAHHAVPKRQQAQVRVEGTRGPHERRRAVEPRAARRLLHGMQHHRARLERRADGQQHEVDHTVCHAAHHAERAVLVRTLVRPKQEVGQPAREVA